ncbi:uracil phosphoribosyltransferase [Salinivirga cyanobacteriivorans]
MKVVNLGETDSVFSQFLYEMRHSQIQQDSMRFRINMQRIGALMAYEISKELQFKTEEVITPLGSANARLLNDQVVLATILRAGLPMQDGMLQVFDRAENAFVSAYRKYEQGDDFHIEFEHFSAPRLDNKVMILADPMMATGASMELSYNGLLQNGTPKHTHIATIIASREGVDYIQNKLSDVEVTLWVGAVDDELTSKSYIVPGLGDAGDLAFGSKSD